MPRELTISEREYIIKSYLSGISAEDIDRELKIGHGRASSLLKDLGLLRTPTERMLLRWKNSTPEQRTHMVENAHKTSKGRKHPPELVDLILRKVALTKQRTKSFEGVFENDVLELLRLRGLVGVPQQPVRYYNIDIGLLPVAVEIHYSPGHPHTSPLHKKRIINLIKMGISPFYIWFPKWKNTPILNPEVADQIVSFYEEIKGHPSPLGKHRVVRCSGKDASRSLNLD